MLNPINACKTPLSSRVAMPIALLLAGIFGLGISMIQPTEISKIAATHVSPASPSMAMPSASLPANADQNLPGPSTEDLIGFCARHVTEKRSFVIFRRGTCVIVNEPCKDPMAEARKILAQCKDPDARFLTEPTNEGEMIVAFKDPVFHRFSKSELEKLRPWLKQTATALLTPDESVAAGEGWIPPSGAQVGLLARRRMLEDATNVVPIKVIRAKERAIAAR
jgi:hypothetical protein